jgi:hypothetical protein
MSVLLHHCPSLPAFYYYETIRFGFNVIIVISVEFILSDTAHVSLVSSLYLIAFFMAAPFANISSLVTAQSNDTNA